MHPFIVALICLVLSGALITYEVRRLARKDAAERARCPYTVKRGGADDGWYSQADFEDGVS